VANALQTICQLCVAGQQPNAVRTECAGCVGATSSKFGVECEACLPGYVNLPDHTACEDIDECLVGKGGCDALSTCVGEGEECSGGCINTDGAYRCGPCPNGFTKTDILVYTNNSRRSGSLCALPPVPPPSNSSGTKRRASVQPKTTLKMSGVKKTVLEAGHPDQVALQEALIADLAASLGIDASLIVIKNIRPSQAPSARRLAEGDGVTIQFDFVINNPDGAANARGQVDATNKLTQQLKDPDSPSLFGAVTSLGIGGEIDQDQDLAVDFVCPPGTVCKSSPVYQLRGRGAILHADGH